MKTTVELPDELLIAAKIYAIERRTSLRGLIEAGLRSVLSSAQESTEATEITWVVVDGGLPSGVDVADREAVHALVERTP